VRGEEEISMEAGVQIGRGIALLERETMRRVAWRLMPVLMLTFFCSYLDRVNVGMAALTMNKQLGFSNAVFGFGAGVFYLGYSLAEIPSNLILNVVGARRWIARIMITWGIVAGLTAFVWNDWSFYAIRVLLGLAEAGYFPGVVLYLTWWFPSTYRTRAMALFFSATLVSNFIGPPLGGLLLQMDGMLGLYGWQWLFVVEALPSVIMAVVVWYLLTDRPTEAAWLRPDQRAWLSERLASERAQQEAVRKYSLAEAFYNPRLWLLTVANFGNPLTIGGVVTFLPLIVRGLGVSTKMVGLVSAVPFLFALGALNYWGWHSDHTGERTWHVAGGYLLCALGLAAGVIIGVGHPVVSMIALTFAIMGLWSALSVFWSLPTALLTGTAAAGGIAMVNGVGMLGGWVGPWMFGVVKDATGSDNTALLCLALAPVISAIAVIVAGHGLRKERVPPRP
jgi:ACS family tartrate transporter-like MFS transporter